jgi:hypothetical protein
MAIVAGLIILVLVLVVQRRLLTGERGVDIDALPGRSARAPS